MDKPDRKKEQNELARVQQIEIEKALESSDSIRVGNTVFSMGKLKKLYSKKKIGDLYKKISQIAEGDIEGVLKYVPQQALPAVQQYYGKKYRRRHFYFVQVEDKRPFQIASMISQIQFHNLQVLNLSNNHITSVEGLTFIYAPNLRCLELYHNSISNLDTLKKADFPKLQVITFYHNPVTKMDQFFRIHSNKLTSYQFDKSTTYKNLLEDYRFLFKMENPIPKMIKVLDENRIDLRKRPYFKILDQPQTTILHPVQRMGNPFMPGIRRIDPMIRRQRENFLD